MVGAVMNESGKIKREEAQSDGSWQRGAPAARGRAPVFLVMPETQETAERGVKRI